MKKNTKKTQSLQMTRREFVGRALATAGVITGAPALLRGQNLNNKLNIAFIACGGRGNASLKELTVVPGRGAAAARKGNTPPSDGPAAPHPDENVVVLCDVNQVALDSASQLYPQAGSSPTSAASSTARTISTPSWCPRRSTPTRLPPTWH